MTHWGVARSDVILSQELFAAVKACAAVDVTILAQIDVIIKAYLAVLAKINASLCGKIGLG